MIWLSSNCNNLITSCVRLCNCTRLYNCTYPIVHGTQLGVPQLKTGDVNSSTKDSGGQFWKKLISTKGWNARWRRKGIRQQVHLKCRYTLPSECITSLLSRRRPADLAIVSFHPPNTYMWHGDLLTFLSSLLRRKDNNQISHIVGRVIPRALRLVLLARKPIWDSRTNICDESCDPTSTSGIFFVNSTTALSSFSCRSRDEHYVW